MALATAPTLDNRKPRGPWQWPAYTQEAYQVTVPAILWALHDNGGEISDVSGQVASKVRDICEQRGTPVHPNHRHGTGLTQLYAQLEGGRYGHCIERVKAEKRTYSMRLLLTEDEMPPRPRPIKTYNVAALNDTESVFATIKETAARMQGGDGPFPGETTPAPAPDPEGPEPMPVPEPEPKIEVDEAAESTPVELVTQLPALVVAPASDPLDALMGIQQLAIQAIMDLSRTPDVMLQDTAQDEVDAEMRRNLASALDESARLRKRLNQTTETLVAKDKELEALRRALNLANNNLAAMREASSAGAREAQLRNLGQVQKLMATPPRNKG